HGVAERTGVVGDRQRGPAVEGVRDVVADGQSGARRRILLVQRHQLVLSEVPVVDHAAQVKRSPAARAELRAALETVRAGDVRDDELLVDLAELLFAGTSAR